MKLSLEFTMSELSDNEQIIRGEDLQGRLTQTEKDTEELNAKSHSVLTGEDTLPLTPPEWDGGKAMENIKITGRFIIGLMKEPDPRHMAMTSGLPQEV